MAAAILSVKLNKCSHFPGVKSLNSYRHAITVTQIWKTYHPEPEKGTTMVALGRTEEGKDGTVLSPELTVGDIASFQMKYLDFECQSTIDPDREELQQVINKTTKKTVNAFQLLMAKGRDYPALKKPSSQTSNLNRKDELFNDLVKEFKKKVLDFPKNAANTEGAYIVQVLCNCLWYLTNQHTTINDTAAKRKEVLPIPAAFAEFQGYNEVKRKKMKSMPLDVTSVESHSNALYSILMKPIMSSSEAWQTASKDIKDLADSLRAYKDYLIEQNKTVKENQNLNHPVRTIGEDATIEHRDCCNVFSLKEEYDIIDSVVKSNGVGTPVVFDECIHLKTPFISNEHRYKFVKNLHLTVPIDIIRFSPGGSIITTLCISQVPSERSEADMLVQGARLLQSVRANLTEKHTRAQRRVFKQKISSVSNLSPAVSDFIYKELTLDGAASAHPVTQERLRLISLGHTGLIADLRHLNPGRPNNKYDTFFEAMEGVVESITAADDRRHGEAHLSEFLSLNEMIEKTKNVCPEGTPVPSKSLVRLQFVPRNPYTHAALNFTSRLKVQYKIQRRQLRVSHVDSHYCNAQFLYMKERAVELGDKCSLFCSDDKAKIPVGEPGSAVSTGVRGRTSIVPTSTTLVALDHDMTKASLTPSVVLDCNIPENPSKSFVNGIVTTAVNDSVFQGSNPFRHAAMLARILETKSQKPPIVMRFTDGGTDQRNTLESVRCSNICLFKEFNLDMLIHLRCAPGQSWINPAERIMSILNIGLQNVSLERNKGGEATEAILKKCGSMAEIRAKADLQQEWCQLLEPVQRLIQNRFCRLKLKGEQIRILDPLAEEQMDILKRHLRELFPTLDLSKLRKSETKKISSYQDWIQQHCKLTQYSFQIRKCKDPSCCLPATLAEEELFWIPDPILDKDNIDHYLPYQKVKGTETTETDRPSLKDSKRKNVKQTKKPQVQNAQETEGSDGTSVDEEANNSSLPAFDPLICSVQNARGVVWCIECEKPRMIYSRHKLTERQEMSLSLNMSEYEYTCGSVLLPPSNLMYKTVMCRSGITCETPIQLPYYASGLGKPDLCCYCASDDGVVCQDLLKRYQRVLPICKDCEKEKNPIALRPWGKEGKKGNKH